MMIGSGSMSIDGLDAQVNLTPVFINKRPKRLGQLEAEVSVNLAANLDPKNHLRIRVVDATPKHLSKDGIDLLHVSIWISE